MVEAAGHREKAVDGAALIHPTYQTDKVDEVHRFGSLV
jgi:hypothetical protein